MPAKLMKASSSLGKGRGPERARLHSLTTPWVAGRQRKGQWLQVTIPKGMTVTSVVTRGRYNGNQWVTYYKLMHKRKHWRWYDGGKWLRGNWDRTHSKKHALRPFKARILRFYPQKWHEKIAMRVEVYGCREKKTVITTSAVAKAVAAHVKQTVAKHVSAATAKAVDAVRKAGKMAKQGKSPEFKLKAMVSAAVHAAVKGATSKIKTAAVSSVPAAHKAAVRKQLSSVNLKKHITAETKKAIANATKQISKEASGKKKKTKKKSKSHHD